eukprot:EG_transcript_5903
MALLCAGDVHPRRRSRLAAVPLAFTAACFAALGWGYARGCGPSTALAAQTVPASSVIATPLTKLATPSRFPPAPGPQFPLEGDEVGSTLLRPTAADWLDAPAGPAWSAACASVVAAIAAALALLARRWARRSAGLLAVPPPLYTAVVPQPSIAMASLFGLKPPPFINPLTLNSVGLVGQWEDVAGNYISFPPSSQRIKGVVYFLGGFFFGRVPQVLYRNLLDEVVRAGYVVVATPYQLQGFDYHELLEGIVLRVNSTDGFLRKKLADLGVSAADLPSYAIGHSCGALLTFLIESFHPDLARQRTGGSAFIAYNNRRATDAIPGLDAVVSPLAKALYNEAGPLPGGSTVGEAIGQQLSQFRDALRGAVQASASLPLIPPIVQKELLPFEDQVAPLSAQIGPLLAAVAKDELNFNPTSDEIRQKGTEAYDAPRTLVVQFDNDTLDETPALLETLRSIERVAGKLQYEKLPGNHFTPLAQDPLPLDRELPPDAKAIAEALNTLSGGLDQQVRSAALNDYRQLARVLLQWLEDGEADFRARRAKPAEPPVSDVPGEWDPEKYDDVEPSA